ncbi:ThiJ/PfpI family protein [Candidatus Paraburkholderia kirkii]|nr:ThiJ/PfpI family protein [Candidatus Paraburkholderia kirkii]
MAISLHGCKVAILAVDGFEQAELVEPQRALTQAGAHVDIVSRKPGQIQGFKHVDKGDVDVTLDAADATDYDDALVLPGGVVNGNAIRLDAKAQSFVKEADEAKKPIAVICHGGWLPISAGIVAGRTMTSWPSLQDDVRNAGGTWVDRKCRSTAISSRAASPTICRSSTTR